MKQSSQDQLQKLTPLLKIVKARQELYLQLLNFIAKNIQSTSNQHEQLSLFTKFLQTNKLSQKQILSQEKQMIDYFQVEDDSSLFSRQNFTIITHVTKNNKQILRLCSRLIEILDASISKSRKSIFNQNGRLSLQFTRFKRNLHNIVKGQTVHLGQFANHILSYIRVKYKKQVAKIQKYIYKLESGAIVALKDLYLKQKSQNSQTQQKPSKNVLFQQDNAKIEHNSQTDSPNKRSSKKPLIKSTKKGHRLFKSTKKQKQLSVNSDSKPPKQYAANKLLKFYSILDLSKKQFLQDLIYQKNEEQEHKKRIMSALLQKNKTISCQINTYYRKSLILKDKIKQLSINNYMRSSQSQKQPDRDKKSPDDGNSSMPKTSSLRKSFVISKRKSSLNFQKNSKILTQHDQSKNDIFSKTIKNFPNKRKISAQTTQKSLNKSKKLFVIKSPVIFEDDNIPQAPVLNPGGIGGGGWFRAPLTTRKAEKKTENLRLKRRNNPLPMEKSLFNQSFKFTDHQL